MWRLISIGAKRAEWIVFLAWIACHGGQAQDTQFLPELDGHLTLNPSLRVYVQAKADREGGDPLQFTFGPALQFYRKPLIRLKNVSIFDLDQVKTRPLVLESGYRIITAPNAPATNRAIEAVIFHVPLTTAALLTDRNRADLDWQSGGFTWRYRNKLALQRTISIHSFHFIPYVAAEPFYESRYGKWSTTDLYAGSLFPVGGHAQFDCYYQHENNTGKQPNRQENFVGLALHLYWSLEDKSRTADATAKRASNGASK
jgi:hypothetical protein